VPAEKHRLLRGAVYLLWLLDSDSPDEADKGGPARRPSAPSSNAFRHRLVKKERFAKLLKRYPVVPLYGDMHMSLQAVLHRCPNFAQESATEWVAVSRKDDQRVQQAYDISAHLPRLRVQAAERIGSLNALLRRVAALGGGQGCRLPREQHTDLAMRLTSCVLHAL
jgi:hypothetical protein